MILIVAPNERKVRIEVGYGLEPILTDALSSVIIKHADPAATSKAGDIAGGIDRRAPMRSSRSCALARRGAGAKADAAAAEFDKPHRGRREAAAAFRSALIFWRIVIARSS